MASVTLLRCCHGKIGPLSVFIPTKVRIRVSMERQKARRLINIIIKPASASPSHVVGGYWPQTVHRPVLKIRPVPTGLGPPTPPGLAGRGPKIIVPVHTRLRTSSTVGVKCPDIGGRQGGVGR